VSHDEAYRSFQRVQNQLEAARFAVSRTLSNMSAGAESVAEAEYPLRPQYLRECAAELELTYSLRLFAAFEGTLRSYWQSIRPASRPRRTPVEVVMNRIASRCSVSYDILSRAHEVRGYRNHAVHHGGIVGVLAFGDCKSRLSRFISYLPRRW